MSVLKGEGRVPIIYGHYALPAPPHRPVYMSRPNAVGRHPPVVMLHGDAGPTPSLRDLCRRTARFGYVAAAPDLFRGSPPGDLGVVASRRAVADGLEVVAALRGAWSGFTASARPAVVGLGASGAVAAEVAGTAGGPLVLFGGPVSRLEEVLGRVRGPVLGLVGGGEGKAHAVRALHEAVGRGEWVVYGKAGTSFYDDDSDDFDRGSFDDAIDRLVGFLDKHLTPIPA